MPAGTLRYASEFGSSGYAVAARRCIGALTHHGVDVAWEPLVERAGFGRSRTAIAPGAPIDLRARRRPVVPDEMTVLHCVPQSWHRLRGELAARHVIGHVVWECEQLPSRWHHELSAADELWVPTEWNRRIFSESFAGPIHVVPHVVDDGPSSPPPIALHENDKVVAVVSAWDWRKRPDRTIDAALHAFSGRRDVVVVVKTTQVPIGWPGPFRSPVEEIADIVSRHRRPPRLIVDSSEWTDAQMLGLFERANCFLSLTSSEGWGLGAFDAASRGTPVVITGYGGQVEWLGADHPGLIPYSLTVADHPDTTLFEPGMRWAVADVDAAIDLVRGVVDGSNTALIDHAPLMQRELVDRYSAATVGDHLRAIIRPTLSVTPTDTFVDMIPRTRRPRLLVLDAIVGVDSLDDAHVEALASLADERIDLEVVLGTANDVASDAERASTRLRNSGTPTSIQRIPSTEPARFRNRLLFGALRDHDWVLWLDSTVTAVPHALVDVLLTSTDDLIQPRPVDIDGEPCVTSAWTDRGEAELHAYRGHPNIELHSVDPRCVLVRAECHREGLVWPAHAHGSADPRARFDPSQTGRIEPGEVETEGLGLLANAMGFSVLGLPDTEIIHE